MSPLRRIRFAGVDRAVAISLVYQAGPVYSRTLNECAVLRRAHQGGV